MFMVDGGWCFGARQMKRADWMCLGGGTTSGQFRFSFIIAYCELTMRAYLSFDRLNSAFRKCNGCSLS
jgi:hypothetical protein